MERYKFLLGSMFFSVLNHMCLPYAVRGVPENVEDLTDTTGVPAVVIYTSIVLLIGFCAVLSTSLGLILLSFTVKSSAFWVRMTVFIASNVLLVLVSLLHALVIFAYLFDNLLGRLGVVLDVIVIVLVVASAPKDGLKKPYR